MFGSYPIDLRRDDHALATERRCSRSATRRACSTRPSAAGATWRAASGRRRRGTRRDCGRASTVRLATSADGAGARAPRRARGGVPRRRAPVLLGVVMQRPVAALSLRDGRVIADPVHADVRPGRAAAPARPSARLAAEPAARIASTSRPVARTSVASTGRARSGLRRDRVDRRAEARRRPSRAAARATAGGRRRAPRALPPARRRRR